MFGLTKLFFFASATLLLLTSAAPTPDPEDEQVTRVKGVAVTFFQEDVDWERLKESGEKFGYVMATAEYRFTSPWFHHQYDECKDAGLYCGAIHIAGPNNSTGVVQAKYFLQNGGGWHNDRKTLPGAVVLGYNPRGDYCFGLTAEQLVKWIHDFSEYYHGQTDRYPVVATTYDWWKTCTGNNRSFNSKNSLWQVFAGKPPGGWRRYSFLQRKADKETEMAHLEWNGSVKQLADFAAHD